MNAPRGLYRTRDDAWVAVSASTAATATRVMRLVGSPDMTTADWFGSASGRRSHNDEIDGAITPWFAARDAADAVATCRAAGVPVAPVFSAADILADPHYEAIGSIGTYEHERLGPVRMPAPLFRLSATPGRVDRLGADLGEHTEEVLGAIGLSPADVQELRSRRIV